MSGANGSPPPDRITAELDELPVSCTAGVAAARAVVADAVVGRAGVGAGVGGLAGAGARAAGVEARAASGMSDLLPHRAPQWAYRAQLAIFALHRRFDVFVGDDAAVVQGKQRGMQRRIANLPAG